MKNMKFLPKHNITNPHTAKQTRGKRTRDNTRAKLIAAAERVMAVKGVEGTTITDITDAADVATGSFYNHFTSKAEIAESAFLQRADELARINAKIFQLESDPALAVSYIQKLFLTKAVANPVWGWFVVYATTDLPQMSQAFSKEATEHVQKGVEAGRFHTNCVDTAVRLILVALIAGMRDVLEGGRRRGWANDVIQCLLQMLGMPQEEARALASRRLPPYVVRLFEHGGSNP